MDKESNDNYQSKHKETPEILIQVGEAGKRGADQKSNPRWGIPTVRYYRTITWLFLISNFTWNKKVLVLKQIIFSVSQLIITCIVLEEQSQSYTKRFQFSQTFHGPPELWSLN